MLVEVFGHKLLRLLAELLLQGLVVAAFDACLRHLLQALLDHTVLFLNLVDLLLAGIAVVQKVDVLLKHFLSQPVELVV